MNDEADVHKRYLQVDGEITCPHCEETFEDWDIIYDPLHSLTLDSEGYCRDVAGHVHKDCPGCGKIMVFGCDPPGSYPYIARGRSEADVRYLERKEADD
jgi:hypothetical protein